MSNTPVESLSAAEQELAACHALLSKLCVADQKDGAPLPLVERIAELYSWYEPHAQGFDVKGEQESMARLGRYVTEFATQHRWNKEEGEGAFEFIQRHSYAVGLEDAGGRPPGTKTWGNRWPVNLLEPLVSKFPGEDSLPQPFAGAITLLETIAEHGMTPQNKDGTPTANSTLCKRFADELNRYAMEPFRSAPSKVPGSTIPIPFDEEYGITDAQVKAAHAVVAANGSYRIGLIRQMLKAAGDAARPAQVLREFEEWLNDERGSDVASVFHELVAKFSNALGAPGEGSAAFQWLCWVELNGSPAAVTAAGVLKDFYQGVDTLEEMKNNLWEGIKLPENLIAYLAHAPHRVEGLGTLTDEDDGIVTLRFVDEDAAQRFMHGYAPTVDITDMPELPTSISIPRYVPQPSAALLREMPACPLVYPLEAYWEAPSGAGPLSRLWEEEPTRLLNDLIAALLCGVPAEESHNFEVCQHFDNWLIGKGLLLTPHTEEVDGPMAPALNWIASFEAFRTDAERWRGVLCSARIRPMGSAGVTSPEPNDYAHLGLEMWTTYDRDFPKELLERMDRETALGRAWLTAYADVANEALGGQFFTKAAGDVGSDAAEGGA